MLLDFTVCCLFFVSCVLVIELLTEGRWPRFCEGFVSSQQRVVGVDAPHF